MKLDQKMFVGPASLGVFLFLSGVKKNMLAYLLSRKLTQRNSETQDSERRYALKHGTDPSTIVLGSIHLVILILAVILAYVCNKRSGKNNPILMAIVAFFFPEIYLIQAGVRSLVTKDYVCAKSSMLLMGSPLSPADSPLSPCYRTPEINPIYR